MGLCNLQNFAGDEDQLLGADIYSSYHIMVVTDWKTNTILKTGLTHNRSMQINSRLSVNTADFYYCKIHNSQI